MPIGTLGRKGTRCFLNVYYWATLEIDKLSHNPAKAQEGGGLTCLTAKGLRSLTLWRFPPWGSALDVHKLEVGNTMFKFTFKGTLDEWHKLIQRPDSIPLTTAKPVAKAPPLEVVGDAELLKQKEEKTPKKLRAKDRPGFVKIKQNAQKFIDEGKTFTYADLVHHLQQGETERFKKWAYNRGYKRYFEKLGRRGQHAYIFRPISSSKQDGEGGA